LKNSLVINPSDEFINTNDEFENIFVDRFIYDQCKKKKLTDKYFSGRLDYNYRLENFKLSNQLFYEILRCVKLELNSIFENNFDQKFFEIIIGAWLRKFIQQFVVKYKNIIEINKKFKIDYAKIYDTKNYNFFTSETHTIQHATVNNHWNSCIYSLIISNLDLDIDLNIVEPIEKNFNDKEFLINKSTKTERKKIKQIFFNHYSNLIDLIPNNSDFFMFNTGFKFSNEKKIDLLFGQLPRIYQKKFKFNYSKFDRDLRNKLNFEKYSKDYNYHKGQDLNKLFNLIIRVLDKSLPLIILEDFQNLIDYSQKLNFPKNPKAICTSYAFESAEPFKFYLAMKKFTNPKMKYFVYQHGGSYITRLDNSFCNECNTCDYFITWGDKTDLSKNNNIKFVNFKLLNKKHFKKIKSEKLLILTRSLGYNSAPYDRYSEGLNELDLTIKLCKMFSKEIKNNTIIRAHYSSKNNKNLLNELHEFKIDYAEQNYFEAINNSKLILFNHDSTGILEILALNKPVLCMWGKGSHHQNEFVKDDYEYLNKAEIFFDDIDKLHNHLIKIWNNPLKWWYSENVQKNLSKFVNLYSRMPNENFNKNFIKMIKDKI
jgi:putative transferase (TIGR04331 family)